MKSLSSHPMWLTWSQTIDHVVGLECPSESDIEEALPSASHTAAQTQSNEEKHNFLVTRGGGRARPREAHSDVPTCIRDQRKNVLPCE